MSARILVAGIGNVFLGDDGFGVEVAQGMLARGAPAGVTVADFGIRGLDLAYALTDDYDAAVLVDAVRRGEPAGTLYVIEVEPDGAPEPGAGDVMLNAHDLNPCRVLGLARSLGGCCPRVLLLACEAESFGGPEGRMGLSAPVSGAVAPAVERLERLIDELLFDLDPISGAARGRAVTGVSS